MTDNDDRLLLFDTAEPLDDAGLPGHALVEAVDSWGDSVFVLADLEAIGDHPGNIVGERQPRHDRLGPLPREFWCRIAELCPYCERPAIYVQRLDRYVHKRAEHDEPCWRAILRTEPDPDRVAAVIARCGRPTRSGRPCRAMVAAPGDACAHHRQREGIR